MTAESRSSSLFTCRNEERVARVRFYRSNEKWWMCLCEEEDGVIKKGRQTSKQVCSAKFIL